MSVNEVAGNGPDRRRMAGTLSGLRLRELLGDLQDRIELLIGTRDKMDGLLDAVLAVASGRELDATLRRIVEAAMELGEAKYGALGVLAEIRTAIFDLHGGAAAETGIRLRHRLHDAIAELTDDAPLQPTVSMSGSIDTVPTQLAEQVEAVVREAVSNAVRHANATTVSVSVAVKDELVRVVVADDGTGLPEGVFPSGLSNLGDRAKAVGGEFTVANRPEGGLALEWSAPA